jgi:hypothetical protein
MPSWCGQVNWGNCGIPWVNCALLCLKDDWKEQFWGLRYCLSKLRSFLTFPLGMTSHSKIVQFNWECIGNSTGVAAHYQLDDHGARIQAGGRNFLRPQNFQTASGDNPPAFQCVSTGFLSQVKSGWDMKSITQPSPMLRLRMSGAVSSTTYKSSRSEQAQVYIYRQLQRSVMMTYITSLYDDLATKHACGLVQEHNPSLSCYCKKLGSDAWHFVGSCFNEPTLLYGEGVC